MSADRDKNGKSLKKIVFLSHNAIMNAHRLVEKVMLKRQQRDNEVAGGSGSTGNTKDLLDIQKKLEQAIGEIDQLLSAMDHGYNPTDSVTPSASGGPGMGGSVSTTTDDEVDDE